MMRKIAVWVLTLVMVVSLAGCGASPETKIQRLNDRFCESYNNLDVEGLLDCLEPSMAESVNAMVELSFGVLGALTDIDLDLDAETMYSLLKVCMDLTPDSELEGMGMPELSMELVSLEVNETEDQAVGTVTMTLEVSGQTQVQTGQVQYINLDGDWYFSNMNFAQ